MDLFLLFLGSIAINVVLSYLLMQLIRNRIREKAIRDTLEAFDDVLTGCADHFAKRCAECGHSRDGHPCDNPDYENIVMFNSCTRFEEKRF